MYDDYTVAPYQSQPPDEKSRKERDSFERMDAILRYANLGMPCHPIGERTNEDGKKVQVPCLKGWPEKATDDSRGLEQMFTTWNKQNVGLMMGREIRPGEFVFALDVDSRNGGKESFQRLVELMPDGCFEGTSHALSGGGGSHYLFTSPILIKNRAPISPDWPGIDVRGWHGYIIVEPSIHIRTGNHYLWVRHPIEGIEPAPSALIEIVRPKEALATRHRVPRASKSGTPSVPRYRAVRGAWGSVVYEPIVDPEERSRLRAYVIEHHPVLGVGQRHNVMYPLVASLIRQGYDDDLIEVVMMDWYDHFKGLGRIRTGRDDARGDLISEIERTRSKPQFQPGPDTDGEAVGDEERVQACREIQLDSGLVTHLKSRNFYPRPGQSSPVLSNTSIGGQPLAKSILIDSSKLSSMEFSFIESVLVLTMDAIHRSGPDWDGGMMLTNKLIMEVAEARHPGLNWTDRQCRREKEKWIGRPNDGKPATRFEFLREIIKGNKRPGQRGIASSYVATGARALLEAFPLGQTEADRSEAIEDQNAA